MRAHKAPSVWDRHVREHVELGGQRWPGASKQPCRPTGVSRNVQTPPTATPSCSGLGAQHPHRTNTRGVGIGATTPHRLSSLRCRLSSLRCRLSSLRVRDATGAPLPFSSQPNGQAPRPP
eukprot:354903-Chlamydomonas_euryale.AAC.23